MMNAVILTVVCSYAPTTQETIPALAPQAITRLMMVAAEPQVK